jgi:hypothetical protein
MDANALAASFPQGIELPNEFRALCDWVAAHGYRISGYFKLRKHSDKTIRLWFGSDAAVGHLAQFGSGPDGSLYCIWRCNDGRHPIVHMGSEGQNNFVLASSPVDFLRLLAIGYDEIGFADLDRPPDAEDGQDYTNPAFQAWVATTFGVTIPKVGAEITRQAQSAHDDFQGWIVPRCG